MIKIDKSNVQDRLSAQILTRGYQMNTIFTLKKTTFLYATVVALLLSGCGDLAFVRPVTNQTFAVASGAATVDIPIEIDFTKSTSARNIVLDGSLNITTAPTAGFITSPGSGQNGWDKMSGKYAVAPGNHRLTASAEYLDLYRNTKSISKEVSFTVLGPQPDLWPSVSASPGTVGVLQPVTFTVTVHNLGQSDAQNVSVLLYTAVPGHLSVNGLQTTSGFSCHEPNGYYPRFGTQCDGGAIAHQDTASISVTLKFPSAGSKVFAVITDPNNAIAEGDESNNLTNTTVVVQ